MLRTPRLFCHKLNLMPASMRDFSSIWRWIFCTEWLPESMRCVKHSSLLKKCLFIHKCFSCDMQIKQDEWKGLMLLKMPEHNMIICHRMPIVSCLQHKYIITSIRTRCKITPQAQRCSAFPRAWDLWGTALASVREKYKTGLSKWMFPEVAHFII